MNKLCILLFLSAFIAAGCSVGKDYTYEPSQESPPGPGLFSGKDGVFTIVGEEAAGSTDDEQTEKKSDKTEQPR